MSTRKLLRESKEGWEVDLRVGTRTRISLGRIRARGQVSISHSLGSSPYHFPSSCSHDIYRSFFSVSLATYCTQPEGGYRRYRVKRVLRYRRKVWVFFFCKASIRPSIHRLSGFITFTGIIIRNS